MRCKRAVAFWRTSRCAVGVVAVAAVMAGCGSGAASSSSGSASPAPTKPPAHTALANAAAFAGHGELAFVSRGTLWVLDGATQTLHRVATPWVTPLDPAFSPDGRWLAFLGSSASPSVQTDTVWLARGDGSGAHEIVGSGGLIGWSPAADVLAVTAGNAIRLLEPSGGVARTLTRAAGLWSAVWSPDGRYLAVATRDWPSATTLASYPVAGGKPTVWLSLDARSGVLNGMREVIIDPAGWWPRWGIGFWVFGDGMVHNNDQTPLDVISASGARPRLLGYTLSDDSAPQAAVAPNGWLAIVNIPDLRNIGRIIWQDKRVEMCSPVSGTCTAVPSRPSAVTLDPAWSPDGSRLAYVQAPYRASPGFPQNVAVAWYGAHQLWLYDPASRSMRKLNANGASAPVWAADGKSLLYVARDAIWLLPRLTGQPVRIAGPLFPPGNWPDYYGQVNWISQFAWWPESSSAAPSPSRPSPVSRQYAVHCLPSQLRLVVGPRISEETQQNTLLLVFRNISMTRCDMRGYPGIALVDSKGPRLPFSYRQRGDQMLTSRQPILVPLPPGGVAYSAINKDSCVTFERRIATRAEVTVPGDHQPLALRLPRYPILGYCGASDPGHTIDITPVEPAAAAVFAQH